MSTAASVTLTTTFPVTWDDPVDARLFWTFDRMHWPTPITPMTGQYLEYMYADGFNRAAQAYELPSRVFTRRINTYHYRAVAPLLQSDEELAAQGQRAEYSLAEAMQQLGENWRQHYLPEIKQHLTYWEAFDLGMSALPDLLSHLDETITRIRRVYAIHFLVYFPFVLAPSLFEELYRDLLGDEQALDAYHLLQGIDTKTLEADRALWQLSRAALATPAVHEILRLLPAAEVVAALETTPLGQDFLARLRAYLDAYGRRSDKSNELDAPHWIEEPTPVISRLQEYITQPDRDLAAELTAQAADRDRLLAETRTRLQGYPQLVIDQFESLLRAAQAGLFVGEEHSYWIDQRATYQVRQVMLEFGRRFAAAGALEQASAIFYLTFDEARATAEALPDRDQRRVVAERRAEMEYFRTIQPPPALGTPPPGPPPADPLSRARDRFFGFSASAQAPSEPTFLRGHAGSPGTARGPARIVRSLAEADKLQPGDVLVAETTMPAWTPLFATAAAVVTDTGGVLSHCAVVAREYGIPAVVGARVATRTLRNGQLIEVDGRAGLVRILAQT
jgi:phosphohistidine swiveling domain-containing protein